MERKMFPVTIRAIDLAVRDWFDKTVDAHTSSNTEDHKKVPVVFAQGERWKTGRTRDGAVSTKTVVRDENGVLMLPVISIRRTSIDPDPTRLALGVQTERITFAKRVDPKTADLQRLELSKPAEQRLPYPPVVYDVYSIPFPDRVVSNYQLVIQTQYISQMNSILEKLWRMLDIQRSFVLPLQNDGRKPPRANAYRDVKKLDTPYLVGFFEESYGDSGNFEEMTDAERVVKYTTSFSVPAALTTSPDGTEPVISVERTAYKVVIPDENVRFVDDPAELDAIFGPKR